jgi:superfamily I DNA/RNA helicase
LIAPDLKAPLAIREGAAPEFVRVPEGGMVRALLKEMEEAQTRWGTLGVIVPERMMDELLVAARGQRIAVDAADWGRGRKITVLTPRQAKGLEFDHVVVAEPSEIAEGGKDGYRQLYVSLTRSTQTLTTFHARNLPADLEVAVTPV